MDSILPPQEKQAETVDTNAIAQAAAAAAGGAVSGAAQAMAPAQEQPQGETGVAALPQQQKQADSPDVTKMNPQEAVMATLGGGGDFVTDTAASIASGATAAYDEALAGIDAAAWWLNDNVLDLSFQSKDDPRGNLKDTLGVNWDYQPEFAFNENFTKPVAQWVTGFIAAGKVLKSLGWAAGSSSKAANFGRIQVQAGLSDAGAFDGNATRLSNLLLDWFPALEATGLDMVAADETDSEIEGRMKAFLEGAFITGPLADAAIWAGKGVVNLVRGETKGAEKALAKAEELMTQINTESVAEGATKGAQSGGIATNPAKDPAVKATDNTLAEAEQAQAKTADNGLEITVEANPSLDLRGGQGEKPLTANAAADAADAQLAKSEEIDNLAGEARMRKLIEPEKLTAFRDDIHRLFAAGGKDMSETKIEFNWDNIVADDDIKALINMTSGVFEDVFRANKKGLSDFASVTAVGRRIAAMNGSSVSRVLSAAARDLDAAASLPARLHAYRVVTVSLADKVLRLADAVDAGKATSWAKSITPENAGDILKMGQAELEHYIALATQFQAITSGLETSMGRNLNFLKTKARSSEEFLKGLTDMDPAKIKRLAARIKAAGTPEKVNATLRGRYFERLIGMHNEFWINSLLGSLKTQVVNLTSNVASVMYHPIEDIAGGILGMDKSQIVLGLRTYKGMMLALHDGMSAAISALWRGEPKLDPIRGLVDTQSKKFIRGQNFSIVKGMGLVNRILEKALPGRFFRPVRLIGNVVETTTSGALDLVGELIRIPTRLTMTQDEFFKTIAYRSRVYSAALAEADTKGLRGEQRKRFLEGRMAASVEPASGAFTDATAMEWARKNVFQEDLVDGTVGKSFENFVNRHPALRLITPFVRTPLNIFRWSWHRTPVVNLTHKIFREELLDGRTWGEFMKDAATGNAFKTSKSRLAAGKIMMGGMIWGAALDAAFNGTLTGAGSTNRELRKLEEAGGFLPYSFEVPEWLRDVTGGQDRLQFSRLDPAATIFGIAADVASIWGVLSDPEREELGSTMLLALGRQIGNKTFLQGLTETAGLLSGDEDRVGFLMRKRAGSYVPGYLRDLAQALENDPMIREVRTYVDAVKARTPGYSEDVPPVRNILGVPVRIPTALGPDEFSPFVTNNSEKNPMYRELARLYKDADAVPGPVSMKDGNVDFTQIMVRNATGKEVTAYDALQEYIGTTQLGGMTLEENLTKLMQSSAYKNASDSTLDFNGSKLFLVQQVINAYRSVGKALLIQNHKNVADALLRDKIGGAQQLFSPPQ